jgi:hypothetical protein
MAPKAGAWRGSLNIPLSGFRRSGTAVEQAARRVPPRPAGGIRHPQRAFPPPATEVAYDAEETAAVSARKWWQSGHHGRDFRQSSTRSGFA